jgi:MFS transporter, DHA2 family, multidrug resistance protein
MTANNNANGLDGLAAATKQLAKLVRQQATVLSFIDVLMILTLLFAGLAAFTLVMEKPAKVPAGAGGH